LLAQRVGHGGQARFISHQPVAVVAPLGQSLAGKKREDLVVRHV